MPLSQPAALERRNAWRLGLLGLGLGLVALLSILAVRRFVALGYVLPVRIVGDSMYPTLVGRHRRFACPVCGFTGRISAATLETARPRCWHCQSEQPLVLLPQPADTVIIDRFGWRGARLPRGSLIAFHEPGTQRLAVKRVVGLPGEQVSLNEGVFSIDGAPWLGPAQFLVDDDRCRRDGKSLWRQAEGSSWQTTPDGHRLSSHTEALQWLRWIPRDDQRFDDVGYNHHVRRSLHPVGGLQLSGRIRLEGEGMVVLRYQTRECVYAARYDLANQQVQFHDLPSQSFAERSFAFELRCEPGSVRLRWGTQDFLLPISPETDGTFAIAGADVELRVEGLLVSRPSYVTREVPEPMARVEWQLHAGEYFVVGDNAPVSRDSRHYGPLSADAILGLVRRR